MEKEFKLIPEFENYQISNDGIIINAKIKHKLSYEIDKDGYFKVRLRKNKKIYNRFVHRLVAITFIPNLEELSIVDHLNRNKQNNSIENLRWVTYSENSRNTILNKSVRLTDMNGNILDFNTAIEAAEYLNVNSKTLNGALNISKLGYTANYI